MRGYASQVGLQPRDRSMQAAVSMPSLQKIGCRKRGYVAVVEFF